jgi:hypothetical protein
MNSFFASVELLDHPELRDVPVAVSGSADTRHGIILAKNQLAWVNVCDGSGGRKENSKVRQDYALRGYPTTLLIDCQSGEVIARGELNEIDAMLAELLQ